MFFTEVYSLAETAPTLGTDAFANINVNATLYYLASSVQSYNEKGWFNYFPQHIGFNGKCGDNLFWKVNDNTLTIFGAGAMWDYDNIDNKAPWRSLNPAPTSLVLEEGITTIGNAAFRECKNLTTINIPDSCWFISGYAFAGCDNLQNVEIPASVEEIGVGAFAWSLLSSITPSKHTHTDCARISQRITPGTTGLSGK